LCVPALSDGLPEHMVPRDTIVQPSPLLQRINDLSADFVETFMDFPPDFYMAKISGISYSLAAIDGYLRLRSGRTIREDGKSFDEMMQYEPIPLSAERIFENAGKEN
jgi:hypothetical protein